MAMQGNYILVNGKLLLETKAVLAADNRAFRYGDGVFETLLWQNGKIRNLSFHVDRIQHAFKMLKLEGSIAFSAPYLQDLVKLLLNKNESLNQTCRIRLQIYRDGGGLYSPISNQAAYLMESSPISPDNEKLGVKSGLIVGIYEEHYKSTYTLSNLKSINCLPFVLAGLYRKQMGLDEVLILNQEGRLCEALSSNIFIYYQNTLYTPALSEGCVDGTMRRAVIQLAHQQEIPVVEAKIDPQILKEAEEVFLTNAIKGVQWVMGFQQKRYFNNISKRFQSLVSNL